MIKRIKKKLSLFLVFLMIFTFLPFENFFTFAAEKDLQITNFDYIQENKKGDLTVKAVIEGSNFKQILNGVEEESVIKDITVRSGGTVMSLIEGQDAKDVKIEVTDSIITIIAPKEGKLKGLNIDTNGKSTIALSTKLKTAEKTYKFEVSVNNMPVMESLEKKKNYVNQQLTIKGKYFDDLSDVIIDGASQEYNPNPPSPNEIKIEKLKKGHFNRPASIELVKESEATLLMPSSSPPKKFKVSFISSYLDSIFVFEKIEGMDNLQVLPREGPYNRRSKITVRALNESGTSILENIFKEEYKVYLRNEKIQPDDLPLYDVKVVKNNAGNIVAIEGWTARTRDKRPIINEKDCGKEWAVVVKDPSNPYSEGITKEGKGFIFSKNDPAPSITKIDPNRGPDTGGTDVLIEGKNFIFVNTPGIEGKITPKTNTVANGNTLKIDYNVSSGSKYGDKVIDSIERDIKVRIASYTKAKNLNIKEINKGDKFPASGDSDYKKDHYSSLLGEGDGLVVTTSNTSVGEDPQEVVMDIETKIKFSDGTFISIPESAEYSPFKYIEKSPTPKIEEDGVEFEYGFFNDSKAEEGETGDKYGVKPLMLRIKGEKFEVVRDDKTGKLKLPTVKFLLGGTEELPAISSVIASDTKVLDKNGNPVDGIYKNLGTTLVISIVPKDKKDSKIIREAIASKGVLKSQEGNIKDLDAVIQITNPSGKSSSSNIDDPKFTFRRPVETDYENINSKQPTIEEIVAHDVPVNKLPSDEDSDVVIRVSAKQKAVNRDDIKVTVDGKNISDRIKSTENDKSTGDILLNVNIPKGFIGKSRIQVITPEGLMDSKIVIFDNMKGPEIKSLTPNSGDKGTIVVIKRDDQANGVTFKIPDSDLENEAERIGSRVLWNGKDINELFNGYEKESGKTKFIESDIFTDFKKKDPDGNPVKAFIPGKYVYVVDPNTIYLKIPDDENLKEGTYNIQVRNPDGSESTIGKPFKIVDTIDKTKLGTINPDTDDIKGGIITTITAGEYEKNGVKYPTNFKGGIDVWFGSQKAEVIGYDINFKKAYVKVPPLKDFEFPKSLDDEVLSYIVPVTIQNIVNKSSDQLNNGFTYLNPNYDLKITKIYNVRYSTDPDNSEAKKGVEGDYVIIQGENLRLQLDEDNKNAPNLIDRYILPKVMFGYTVAEKPVAFGAKNVKDPGGTPQLDDKGRAQLEWIKVKVPQGPDQSAGQDSAVNVLVQNPDGAKDIVENGFIYKIAAPKINEETSVLKASRFHDNVVIRATDINKERLIVAFGEKIYEKALSSASIDLASTKEVENIVVRFIPNKEKNIEIYYKDPSGKLVLMTDTIGTTNGKAKIGSIGDTIILGLNWKNPKYHSTKIKNNKDILKTLNTEYISITTKNKAPNVNSLILRRGLGKVTEFVLNEETKEAAISVDTPYNDKEETTTVTLINADGSSAKAPFIFHGGINPPVIEDIDGSKDRDLTIEGKHVKGKVYTSDFTSDTEITIIGDKFKDVEKVMVGDKEVQVLNVSTDYKKMRVNVPKGEESEVGIPLPITIIAKEGTAYSSKSKPPVYFMYIKAGSKPIIENITPSKGPQTGGTKVLIEGKDFKEIDEFGAKGEIKVYFGGIEGKVNKIIRNEGGDIISLEAITPKIDSIDDQIKVNVKNADEGRSEPYPFKYISQPVVEKIEGDIAFYAEPAKDGESEQVKIKIIGKNFYNPEKVIIGGRIVKIDKNLDKVEKSLMLGVKNNGSNQYVELGKNKNDVTEGIEITGIEQDSNSNDKNRRNTTSFNVIIPDVEYEQIQNLAGQNIIVINSDGGISPEKPIKIHLPIPDAPVIIATPGYYSTMNLSWSYKDDDRNKATRFEIYAKEYGSENDYNHVGSIMKNENNKYSYMVNNLKPDTMYQFKVRVMNKFGEAKDFGYAKAKTLRKEDDRKQKEKLIEKERASTNIRQNGTKEIVGNTLKYNVGTKENVVDLNTFAKVNNKEIRISVPQIKLSPNSTIIAFDQNMSLTIPFKAFDLNQVKNASDNGNVVISINGNDGKINSKVSRKLPRNKKRGSLVYNITMNVEDVKNKYPISFVKEPLEIKIVPNDINAGGNLALYNPNLDKIIENQNPKITHGGYYVLVKSK